MLLPPYELTRAANWSNQNGGNYARLSLIVLVCAGVTGCLPKYEIDNQPTAFYQLEVTNDSTHTTGQSVFTWVFKDQECHRSELGMRLSTKWGNGTQGETDREPIAAGREFVFTATYVDARFAQNRQCSVTGAFTPVATHFYKAKLVSSDNVQACKLGVYDVTAGDEQ